MPFELVDLNRPCEALHLHPATSGEPQPIPTEMLADLIAENLVLSALHQPRSEVHRWPDHRVLTIDRAAKNAAKRMAGGDPDSVLDELLHLPVDLQRCQIGAHGFPFPDHRRQPEARNERETVQILASADERPRVTVQNVEHLERRLGE